MCTPNTKSTDIRPGARSPVRPYSLHALVQAVLTITTTIFTSSNYMYVKETSLVV